MSNLASYFDNDSIDDCIEQFGLTPAQQADVRDKTDIKTRAKEALRLWRQQNYPLDATFGALIKILLDLRRGDVACRVCDILKNYYP